MDVYSTREIYDSVMSEISKLAKFLLTEKFSQPEDDDMFAEVACDYFDPDEELWAVDAWPHPEDPDDEEEEVQGHTIAYIDPESLSVTWVDDNAIESVLANEVIKEKIEELERTSA